MTMKERICRLRRLSLFTSPFLNWFICGVCYHITDCCALVWLYPQARSGAFLGGECVQELVPVISSFRKRFGKTKTSFLLITFLSASLMGLIQPMIGCQHLLSHLGHRALFSKTSSQSRHNLAVLRSMAAIPPFA